MENVLAALFPVFALIAIGIGLKRAHWLPEAFWSGTEKLVYYLFFPALLVHRMAGADMAGLTVWPVFACVVAGIVVLAGLTFVLRPRLPLDGPGFTSLFQGTIRFNSFVALAVPAALYGNAGTVVATLCLAAAIPLINVFCVLVLARHGQARGAEPSAAQVGRMLASNPLILAIVAGLALNVSGLGLPPLAGPLLDILARPALPLALIAVGAGLDLAAARAAGPMVALTGLLKLAVMPAVVWATGAALGLQGMTLAVCVLWGAMPTAASAYVLARLMGGDARLMAGIITATTLASFAGLPIVLLLID